MHHNLNTVYNPDFLRAKKVENSKTKALFLDIFVSIYRSQLLYGQVSWLFHFHFMLNSLIG